jgi:hypothetical protein
MNITRILSHYDSSSGRSQEPALFSLYICDFALVYIPFSYLAPDQSRGLLNSLRAQIIM